MNGSPANLVRVGRKLAVVLDRPSRKRCEFLAIRKVGVAELTALHPKLPIVFAGNRKLANAWCHRFFIACRTREASPQLDLVRETLSGYDPVPRGLPFADRVRDVALHRLEAPFTLRELAGQFEEANVSRVRRVVDQLRLEGLLDCSGRGPRASYSPVGA